MTSPHKGEVWWAEAEDKRRPVLVVTRSEAIPVLSWVVVAPVTRTVRGLPTEVGLGAEEGLGVRCAATFDNLQVVARWQLTTLIGSLGARGDELCRALAAMADC